MSKYCAYALLLRAYVVAGVAKKHCINKARRTGSYSCTRPGLRCITGQRRRQPSEPAARSERSSPTAAFSRSDRMDQAPGCPTLATRPRRSRPIDGRAQPRSLGAESGEPTLPLHLPSRTPLQRKPLEQGQLQTQSYLARAGFPANSSSHSTSGATAHFEPMN